MVNKKNAFSLIELSIVILVIGIIVAAVVSSNSIVSKSNSVASQKLSEGIQAQYSGLTFWFDAANSGSFSNTSLSNNTSITSVKNLIDGVTLTGGSAVYLSSVLNGRPGLSFNNSSSYSTNAYNMGALFDGTATVFAVTQGSNINTAFTYGLSDAGNNQKLYYQVGYTAVNFDCAGSSYAASSPPATGFKNVPFLISTTLSRNTASTGYNMYYNGSSIGSGTTNNAGGLPSTCAASASATFVLPNNFGFPVTGVIGEILIFNRVMPDSERKEIESYLGKKWGIKIT